MATAKAAPSLDVYRKMKEIKYWSGLAIICLLGAITILSVSFGKGAREFTKEAVLGSIFLGGITILSVCFAVRSKKKAIHQQSRPTRPNEA
jgi:hypothetical protein